MRLLRPWASLTHIKSSGAEEASILLPDSARVYNEDAEKLASSWVLNSAGAGGGSATSAMTRTANLVHHNYASSRAIRSNL